MVIVSITIVTWNSGATIRTCLDAVFTQTLTDIEVIVIDNNSTDDTLNILQDYSSLKVLKQDSNLGFAKAHNIGIAQSQGKYILPLNPDVIMTETYLENMVKAAEGDPQVGMVAGKLLLFNADEKPVTPPLIDSTGLFLEKTRRQFIRGHGQPDSGQYEQQEYVFGACGAAPLYRKEMLETCKFQDQYFDENFFAHKEDVDLAWRAQLLGWKSLYAPQAVALHNRSFRPGKRQHIPQTTRMHAVKNRYLLLIKNELGSTFAKHALHILFYDLKILVYILFFEPSSIKGIAKAIALIPLALRWRKFTMSQKKVNAEYILHWMK